jgi:hypothetical protein
MHGATASATCAQGALAHVLRVRTCHEKCSAAYRCKLPCVFVCRALTSDTALQAPGTLQASCRDRTSSDSAFSLSTRFSVSAATFILRVDTTSSCESPTVASLLLSNCVLAACGDAWKLRVLHRLTALAVADFASLYVRFCTSAAATGEAALGVRQQDVRGARSAAAKLLQSSVALTTCLTSCALCIAAAVVAQKHTHAQTDGQGKATATQVSRKTYIAEPHVFPLVPRSPGRGFDCFGDVLDKREAPFRRQR